MRQHGRVVPAGSTAATGTTRMYTLAWPPGAGNRAYSPG